MEVSGWVYILGITYVCTTGRIAEFQAATFTLGGRQARVRRFSQLESRAALAELQLSGRE